MTRPSLPLLIGALALSACATTKLDMSTTAPSPDRRVGLRAGWWDAGQAFWNLRMVSTTPPPPQFIDRNDPGAFKFLNSDLTLTGHYVVQGNFSGLTVWDIANPSRPRLVDVHVCPGAQNDVSVYRNLLFVSDEAADGRLDCGTQGVPDTVSKERIRGIRIYDIGDITHPRNITNVQTCRGSHTHTLVSDPHDTTNVYIYVSGSAPVRSPSEMPGCSGAPLEQDPSTALFRIEVIQVPVAAPQLAKIVSSPRIFLGLNPAPGHGEAPQDIAAAQAAGGFTTVANGLPVVLPRFIVAPVLDSLVKVRGGSGAPSAADSATLRTVLPAVAANLFGSRTGPTQCHDITAYPAIGRAGGACRGYGLLVDIRDPVHPRRIGAVSDTNMVAWHSITFNNDGTKVLFSDEWGGGLQPRCRATDRREWGANAIFTLKDSTMTFKSYYKLPAPQTATENCVAHNGSMIPVPGRDIMVQGWYQGGVSVFDFTDASHPVEIAYFDRGPMDATKLEAAGSWSAYWFNGYIVSSDLARGLDILELLPSGWLSQNELAAAKLVHFDQINVQDQQRPVWPASFVLSRAYLDQLERSKALSPDRLASARQALKSAEGLSGAARQSALQGLASTLERDSGAAGDPAKVRALAGAVRDLANAPPAR